jgi:phage gpG-like protein
MKPSFNISPKTRIEDMMFEFNATGEHAEHLKPVMEEIVDIVLFRNYRTFRTRGATSGRYWSPLKASTVKRKARISLWEPEDPLVRSGKLMESLTQRHAPNQVLDIDDDGFYLATTLPYAEHHVTGDPGRMPARPPLIVPAKHAREYIKKVNDFIFQEFGE